MTKPWLAPLRLIPCLMALVALTMPTVPGADAAGSLEELERASVAAYQAGDHARAAAFLEQIRDFTGLTPSLDLGGPLYNLACTYALDGRTREALEVLKAILPHGTTSHAHLGSDPDLDSLRDLPEFPEICM